MVDDRLYSVNSDGTLTVRTYDGTTFGPETAFPTWTTFSYATSMAYDGEYLYYTKLNDARLYRRGLGADGFIIDPIERVVSGSGDGLNWSNTIGLAVVDGRLLAAASTGDLTATDLVRFTPVAASRTTISGPKIDGMNWNARDLLAF